MLGHRRDHTTGLFCILLPLLGTWSSRKNACQQEICTTTPLAFRALRALLLGIKQHDPPPGGRQTERAQGGPRGWGIERAGEAERARLCSSQPRRDRVALVRSRQGRQEDQALKGGCCLKYSWRESYFAGVDANRTLRARPAERALFSGASVRADRQSLTSGLRIRESDRRRRLGNKDASRSKYWDGECWNRREVDCWPEGERERERERAMLRRRVIEGRKG